MLGERTQRDTHLLRADDTLVILACGFGARVFRLRAWLVGVAAVLQSPSIDVNLTDAEPVDGNSPDFDEGLFPRRDFTPLAVNTAILIHPGDIRCCPPQFMPAAIAIPWKPDLV